MSQFNNIAISGGIAVGTTSLMNQLKISLAPKGFTFMSTGNLFRSILKERKAHKNQHIPLAENLEDSVHLELEKKVHDMLASGDKYVIEGWLAGFISRDLDHTLRVLVTLPDIETRIQRFMNREGVTEEEAREYIQVREKKNIEFWKTLYGNHDFWNPKYFHVSVNTKNTGKQEAADIVLKAFNA